MQGCNTGEYNGFMIVSGRKCDEYCGKAIGVFGDGVMQVMRFVPVVE